jgi:hypothetical protein
MGPHPCEEIEDLFARPSARAFSDARPVQRCCPAALRVWSLQAIAVTVIGRQFPSTGY